MRLRCNKQMRLASQDSARNLSQPNETYSSIWNEAMPRRGRIVADAPILERHNPTFDPRTGEGGIALWVPLA
jgi:AraC family transcriptional regulator